MICLCRRKKKYQLEERVVGEDSGDGGAQCEKEAEEEEVYRTKRSVVVKHARNHAHIDSSEQRAETDVDDDERIKAIVDKFKQNVENNTETNVTTQRCDVSAANDPLLPLRMLLLLLRMLPLLRILLLFGLNGSNGSIFPFVLNELFQMFLEKYRKSHNGCALHQYCSEQLFFAFRVWNMELVLIEFSAGDLGRSE